MDDLEPDQSVDSVEAQSRIAAKLIAEARRQLSAIERAKKDARREYARDYYAKNRERYLEDQRRYRAERKAADPERYRQQAQARNKRWRDSHKDQENAKLRAKYAANRYPTLEQRAASYEKNAEVHRERRRAYYKANKDRINAEHRLRRSQDRARFEAGLPSRRLHSLSREERWANDVAANVFFARSRTVADLLALKREEETPDAVLTAFRRDCSRARAAHFLHTQVEELTYLRNVLDKESPRARRLIEREAEDARMDQIARGINERLRIKPSHDDGPRVSPAAPHLHLQQQQSNGLSR